MDRALRLTQRQAADPGGATNDPRFHVGWRHLDQECASLRAQILAMPAQDSKVVLHHLDEIDQLRAKAGVHPKIAAVGQEIAKIIAAGEKVVIFCHHHLTAQELTAHLGQMLPVRTATGLPNVADWREAWKAALTVDDEIGEVHREVFIEWLCSPLVRGQVWRWIGLAEMQDKRLHVALQRAPVRGCNKASRVAAAATDLLKSLVASSSSEKVLKHAASDPSVLPGANGRVNVVGICDPGAEEEERPFFLRNTQPDTVIAAFNSPVRTGRSRHDRQVVGRDRPPSLFSTLCA